GPRAGAPVQCRCQPRLAMLQLDAQQLTENVVKAIPLAMVVQGHEEEIRPRELTQLLTTPGLFEHRVTQRRTQAIKDRAAKHEGLQRRVMPVEDFVDEKVDNRTVGAAEAIDERVPVVGTTKRQCREVEPGGPALCPLDELVDVGPGQRELE